MPSETLIGIISDTHGTLTQAAIDALQGVMRIIHAGDVDRPEILTHLRSIAPVTAVRGNMDRVGETSRLPVSELVEIAGVSIYALHDFLEFDLDPGAAGIHVVVYGHTHRAEMTERKGVWFINPGSASHPRGEAAPSLVLLHLHEEVIQPELIYLKK